MTQHYNKLTEIQQELLALLSEEAAESIHMIGKIMRHGLDSRDPTQVAGPYMTNRDDLETEIGHLHAAIQLLVFYQVLDMENMEEATHDKLDAVGEWLHHAEVPQELLRPKLK
jgi:hypothetical protein